MTSSTPMPETSVSRWNPYPETRDSGVEWLGAVPAHWQVKRLKHLGQSIIGLTYSPVDVTDAQNGILLLRASNVQEGRLAFEDVEYVRSEIPEDLVTREGDILICSRSGSRSLIGKNARIEGKGVGVTFGAFMTVFRSGYNHYLYHVFNSNLFEQQAGSFITSTINQLTVSVLNNIQVPFPPLPEQRAIAAFLDRETTSIDNLIGNLAVDKAKGEKLSVIARFVLTLQEYRAALISAAVTGKIDVRSIEDGAQTEA